MKILRKICARQHLFSTIFVCLLTVLVVSFSLSPFLVPHAETAEAPVLISVGQHTNVTTHTEDIVLSGNDVMIIKDAQFELNGSLFMSGNSTLIIDNSELVPVFGRWQCSYELRDNAEIIMKRNSKIVSAIFDFTLCDNSLLNVTDSEVEKSVYGEPHARVQAYDSHLRIVSLIADYRGGGHLTMISSSAGSVSCSGDAQIVNSSVENLGVAMNARIVDSQIGSLGGDRRKHASSSSRNVLFD